MKYPLFFFTCTLILFGTGLLLSQNRHDGKAPLSLQEALNRAYENHPSIQIRQTFVAEAEGQKSAVAALPNPEFSYYREDLNHGEESYGEWMLAAGIPLNFLWERWSAKTAASEQIAAQELLVDDVRRKLKFEVQQAYGRYLYLSKMSGVWREVNSVFETAVHTAETRFSDGDISNYELQRIIMERLRYQKSAADAEAARLAQRHQLSFLIFPQHAHAGFDEVQELNIAIPASLPEDLTAAVLQKRPDVLAAVKFLESQESALTAEKWKRLPELNFSYGYKEQSDDLSGSVLQLSLGIPIFNINQGKVRKTRAERDRQTLELTLLEKQVESEIHHAVEQFRFYRDQYPQFNDANEAGFQQALSAALAAYKEGEMSLVELLDAVNAYVETFQIRYDFLTQYYISFFELEKVTAMSSSEF